MATRAVSADAAVVEVLNARNYVDWSVLVKNYLLAQDLWDVVEEDEEDEEEEEADDKFIAWRKKNATALHTIQISCGREAFSLIRNTTSAKRAWDTLAEKFKPKPGIHIEPAISDIHVIVQNEGNEECNLMKITRSVVGFLQGLKSNLLELLGINRIREIKQAHIQSDQLLRHMCELIKHSHSHDYVLPAIFGAIERGMFEFTDTVLQARPNLIWTPNQKGRVPFQFAIECRQEKIYSLIYRLDKRKRTLMGHTGDNSGNSMLHMAGMLSPLAKLDNISGAALQMQRELQWFKEVETIGLPWIKECTNQERMTPRELFTKNHKELVKEGERWMKGTIMFAAAFTVPGGNNGETGFPIFLHKNLFMAFIVSDSISLFSSTTSVLMFLGILTSRYAEDDFLKSLPTKMIIGLSTLFISIATMMVAFSSALFIMIHEQSWIVIPMIFLASVPVTLFIWMQFPLLVEMYISTYGGGIFDKKVKSRA